MLGQRRGRRLIKRFRTYIRGFAYLLRQNQMAVDIPLQLCQFGRLKPSRLPGAEFKEHIITFFMKNYSMSFEIMQAAPRDPQRFNL